MKTEEIYNNINNVEEKTINNVEEDINAYISQLLSLEFIRVDDPTWKLIKSEGLDREYTSYNKSDWYFIRLNLKDKDKRGLKNFESETIEKFNLFDIKLKDEFNLLFIDLIDYDKGDMVIVTTIAKV